MPALNSITITNFQDYLPVADSQHPALNFEALPSASPASVAVSTSPASPSAAASQIINYDSIINFNRSECRQKLTCVMCSGSHGVHCTIPNQNKDICNLCDSLFWKVLKLNIVVKFCKGCKNFCHLHVFGEKPLAAKCAKCRQRGRLHYHKMKSIDSSTISSPAAVAALPAHVPASPSFSLPLHSSSSTTSTTSTATSSTSTPFLSSQSPMTSTPSESRNLYLSPPPAVPSPRTGRSISPLDPHTSSASASASSSSVVSCSFSSRLDAYYDVSSPLPTHSSTLSKNISLDEKKHEDFVDLPCIPSLIIPPFPSLSSCPSSSSSDQLLSSSTSASTAASSATPSSGNGVWDPSLHPLVNLAVLSEHILLPSPSQLQYPIPSPPQSPTDVYTHEKKRKRSTSSSPPSSPSSHPSSPSSSTSPTFVTALLTNQQIVFK